MNRDPERALSVMASTTRGSAKHVLTVIVIGILGAVVIASASASFRGERGVIAFDFWEGQSMEIGVLNTDGTRTNLTSTSSMSEGTPRWSRDGKKIVYMSRTEPFADPPRPPDIWVMNADGSGRTRLTNSPGLDCWPAPAPTGSKVRSPASGTGTRRSSQ